jgi:hypothetical protein
MKITFSNSINAQHQVIVERNNKSEYERPWRIVKKTWSPTQQCLVESMRGHYHTREEALYAANRIVMNLQYLFPQLRLESK